MFMYMSWDKKDHLFSFTEDNPEETKDMLDARWDVSTGNFLIGSEIKSYFHK